MKILFIIPGSGDSFYCGNCFRDNLQAAALRKAGHDVIIMPLYLPLRQPSFQADTPLFFPATTYYAAQKFFGKRHMPAWLARMMGSDTILKMAAGLSGTTSAGGTESMTLSMITGNDPAFFHQMTTLIDWIKNHEKPDIIHLSSTLLLGVAKIIRQEVEIPIVCSLQDEEVWIDSMDAQSAAEAWNGISDNLSCISGFVTTSCFYRDYIQKRIPTLSGIEVIYPGVDVARYHPVAAPSHPVIGFFYRMNEADGLDILAEAFVRLKKKNTIPQLHLKIGGGYSGQDKRFLKKVRRILAPYKEFVTWCDNYSYEEHTRFFGSVTVLSVPIRFQESVGLYLCEAFAAGCPAVEPATGSFREIIGEAGLTYEPNTSEALASALENLLSHPALLEQCRQQAKERSRTRYNDAVLASRLLAFYQKTTTKSIPCI